MKDQASSHWWISPPPPAAIEISAQRVSVVALSTKGSVRTVSGQASEPLAAGVVTPALNAVNVHDSGALSAAIKAAVDRITPRPRRAALILPDTVGKVSLVRFDKVPGRAEDLGQLLRWQVRKTAPFRVEDAQVSWSDGAVFPEGGREYFVVLARRDIVESYERACEAAGVHTGIVDLISSNMVNALLATQPAAATGDWLLVHTAADYSTLIVVRDGRVIFFRNRTADAASQDMGDLVHQTAMYYEDRLGGTAFSRVVLAGASAMPGTAGDHARRQIEERLGVRVQTLDVSGGVALRDRINPGPELLDALAPAVGVLLRDVAASGGAERA